MAFPSPTAAYTATDLAAMINEVWTNMVLEARFEGLTIINHATDLSEYMSEGGDIAHVPNIYTNLFTVSTQTTQGDGVVDQSPAQVDVTLTVNTHKYIAFVIGDKDMKQLASKYSLNEKYMKEATRLCLQAIEDALFALEASVTTNTTGNAAGAVTDLHIRTAIQKLTSSSGNVFPTSEMAFFWDPAIYWLQITAYQKYYDKSQNGMDSVVATGNFGPMGSGNSAYVGKLYNIPCYISPRVVKATNVAQNLLLHKEAFGFAIQNLGANRVRPQVSYLHQNLATLATVDTIFGVGVLREVAACLIEGLNTTTVA